MSHVKHALIRKKLTLGLEAFEKQALIIKLSPICNTPLVVLPLQ